MGSLWGMKVLEFLTGLISPEEAAYVEGSRLIKYVMVGTRGMAGAHGYQVLVILKASCPGPG